MSDADNYMRSHGPDTVQETIDSMKLVDKKDAEIQSLQDKVAELEKALKQTIDVIASLYADYKEDNSCDEDYGDNCAFFYRELYNARQALSPEKDDE